MIERLRRLASAARRRLGWIGRLNAIVLARRGRFSAAQRAYARARGLPPDCDESWVALGRFLDAHGGLPLAIAALQGGLGRGAGPQAQAGLLAALVRAGRTGELMELAARLSDPDAALAAATAAAAAGHLAEAERLARLASTLAPQRADAWFQLGSILARLGRYDDAIAALEESIAHDPSDLAVRATLGQVLAHLGRIDESAKVFQALLRRDPANAGAWSAIVHLARQRTNSRNIGEIARQVAAFVDGAGDAGRTPAAPPPAAARTPEARLRLAPALLALLPADERIVVLDGGARDAHDDPRWRELPPERLEFHGFEPDPLECERLNRTLREFGYRGAYYPVGLWKAEGKLPFHVNKASGGSSFLDQNTAVTDRWRFENPHQTSLAREVFRPDRTIEMPVTSIERWGRSAGIAAIDFCKLNVQGAELDILAATGPYLDSVLGILAEASFVESYVGRPFFSDIDAFLRRAGFTFFDLLAHHYVGRADAPVVAQHLPGSSGRLGQLVSSWGQLIEGHALFLRDPIAGYGVVPSRGVEPNHVIKLAVIAEVFGQVEFAFEVVQWLAARRREAGDGDGADRLAAAAATAAARYRGETPPPASQAAATPGSKPSHH
jgi:FkbM family methyltransferase